MKDPSMAPGSQTYRDLMNRVYDERFIKMADITGKDFYGLATEGSIGFVAARLRLNPKSHLLDLCSGIGGPARFLAATYGCKVTGVDISELNCRAAQKKTRESGLDRLVAFVHANALDISFPDKSFTHVFGCEGWGYFPDKEPLYRLAYQLLKPGGRIAFLDSASATRRRFHFEEVIGPYYYESIAGYTAMLRAAGFQTVRRYDTTPRTSRDVLATIHRFITHRQELIAALGADFYLALLEVWTEHAACFSEGQLRHCGFIGRKP